MLGYGRGFKAWVADFGDLRPEHVVLDVGIGTGVLARELLGRHPTLSLSGIDPDPKALRIARRAEVRSLARAVGEALPFADRTFDRVFSTLALHHVPDAWRGRVFAEIRRVLKADGTFIYVDFENHRRWWVPRRFASARRLGEWLEEAGFAHEQVGHRRGAWVFRARARRDQ